MQEAFVGIVVGVDCSEQDVVQRIGMDDDLVEPALACVFRVGDVFDRRRYDVVVGEILDGERGNGEKPQYRDTGDGESQDDRRHRRSFPVFGPLNHPFIGRCRCVVPARKPSI